MDWTNYASEHPKYVKENVATIFFQRAKKLCSNNELYNEEKLKIQEILLNNDYSQNLINKIIKKVDKGIRVENSNIPKWYKLTYVKGLTEVIKKILKREGFNNLAVKAECTLGDNLLRK